MTQERFSLAAAVLFLGLAMAGLIVGCSLDITDTNNNVNHNGVTPTPTPTATPTPVPCFPAGAPCGGNLECCSLLCLENVCR